MQHDDTRSALANYLSQGQPPALPHNPLTPPLTPLPHQVEDGLFSSESERLLLVDRRDYNTLGLGLDDLIEAFVQTVLAVTAIDHMCTVRRFKGGRYERDEGPLSSSRGAGRKGKEENCLSLPC